jgi:hypothetical protein
MLYLFEYFVALESQTSTSMPGTSSRQSSNAGQPWAKG